MSQDTKLAEKYNRLAEGFTEKSHAHPEELLRRRAELVVSWGATLGAGDTVLELGCGDGSMAYGLAKNGLRYTGTDLAPGMIQAARARAARNKVQARFFEMDMNRLKLTERFDCIFGFCRTFFAYCQSPTSTLQELKSHVRRKVIVDWNRYSRVSLEDAVTAIRGAGFRKVSYRPLLIPSTHRLPPLVQNVLYSMERIPVLGLLPTRWRFSVILKGEVE